MSVRRLAILGIASSTAVLQACELIDGGPSGPATFGIALFGIPQSDTLRQTGLEFAFESPGARPYRSVVVVVDPGTVNERSFAADSAWRAEAPERFPVVVVGPLDNGRHAFELRVEDANGGKGMALFSRVIHVTDIPYQLEFLGAGYDDSRAAGIAPSGLIAGTVYTGTSPSQTARVVAWSNGALIQPRSQSSVTRSTGIGINDHGEIVGMATVSGNLSGFFWRGDSLEVLSVSGQRTIFANDIDDTHRALVFVPGISVHLLDVNTNTSTPVPVPSTGLRMNGLGQVVGLAPQLYGTTVATHGGLTIRYPDQRPGRHERFFRGVRWDIFGLNDRSEVLGSREGDPFLSHSGTVEYLAQRLPPAAQLSYAGSAYCLAASGDVVSVSGSDSLFMWSAERGTRRLTFTNAGWKIDGLVAMNENGQLVAHGVNAQSNQKGALLLTPVTSATATANTNAFTVLSR